ncbi:MAG: phosphatase PAP2 family protein [Prolixibacteraceae bacterium]|jgi:undecaprenyl-diphosphatase|nr:phosphatase PAP2 family protein [Prolixibacteraceae bacterium]
MFEWLNQIDTQFFLSLNGAASPFFDRFFAFFTSKETWYPLYILLMFLIVRKYKMQSLWVILFFIVLIVLSDQISGLIKDLVGRLRPTHEPLLEGLVHNPTKSGGYYSFLSSHATNSFALAVLTGFVSQRKRLWIAFLLWAAVTSYSRVYVGVHYPFDIICGAILGVLIAWGVYRLLKIFDEHFQRKRIEVAGRWKAKHANMLIVALLFIVSTLLIVSKLGPKYF